ncbi:hypothetical protein DCS_01845 [Drechmeria coniospora]|uniref:HAUS augmin-like complex subunit 1 n=1 Tax=Drechmeria coniospora TaxID=98403 RepID=A0A151GUC9_DRECN|nr:hypothetical protein DCS_01845 [Drechmeria coniospora]KYK60707.1 hypothetical protein DCS_01845 [Drechmeria coniospora]
MAHHRHLLQHDSISGDAIFSPTVARLAASNARDWSHIDSWIASKFPPGTTLPPFERNRDTLEALLALVSANEAADEENRMLLQAEIAALEEVKSAHAAVSMHTSPRQHILTMIQDELSEEGKMSLDSLARTVVQTEATHLDPCELGSAIVALQSSICEVEQMTDRVDSLQRLFHRESEQATQLLRALEGDDYAPPADLATVNLNLQRRIKSMSTKHPAAATTTVASVAAVGHPTVKDIAIEEQHVHALLDRKRILETEMARFAHFASDSR